MYSYSTNYGELKSISLYTTYPNQQLKDCVLSERNELNTPFGILVPQYDHVEIRRKNTYSVSFFENGILKRIALQDQVEIDTCVGKLPAELITFYNSGKIKKIFPLNGHITAYWDENDEYNLAKEFYFDFPFGSFKTKIISIGFYETGTVKSITLWPNEYIYINTPIGKQRIRIGFSLYPDGSIKSIEPIEPIDIMTPIGNIKSFDVNANGVTGDKNSLAFTEDGKVKSLISSDNKITIKGPNNTSKIYSPFQIKQMCDQEIYYQTLKIEFCNDIVIFNEKDKYKIEENSFIIEPFVRPVQNKCSNCSSCSMCSTS